MAGVQVIDLTDGSNEEDNDGGLHGISGILQGIELRHRVEWSFGMLLSLGTLWFALFFRT